MAGEKLHPEIDIGFAYDQFEIALNRCCQKTVVVLSLRDP